MSDINKERSEDDIPFQKPDDWVARHGHLAMCEVAAPVAKPTGKT